MASFRRKKDGNYNSSIQTRNRSFSDAARVELRPSNEGRCREGNPRTYRQVLG